MRPPFRCAARTVALAWLGASIPAFAALAACGAAEPAPPPSAPQAPPPVPAPPVVAAAPAPETVSAPEGQKPSHAALAGQAADAVIATLQGMREAFDAHDAKKVASYYSDDCVVGRFFGADAHGRADAEAGLQAIFEAFADVKSAPLRRWVAGDVVFAENVWVGTMTGDYAGIKATHKPVGQIALRVMRLDDQGRVKELREYADDAGILMQMTGRKNAPPVPILPSNSLEVHVAKGTPEEEQLASWARELDETLSKDDAKTTLAAMADDAEYWTTFEGPATRGKKDLEKRLRAWLKAFADPKWTTTHAWGVDGFAIVEHVVSGTFKGPLGPLPASRKPVAVTDWHWVDVLQPTGDRSVARGWGFSNLMELQQQVSSLPSGTALPGGIEKKTNVAPADRPKSDTPPVPKKK